jgi:hypothetical protein
MNEKINLKELERKVYVLYHQDGLVDIFIGFFLLATGMMMFTDMAWLAAVFWFAGISSYAAAKKTFTVPRIGYVKFGESKIRRMWTGAVIALSLSALLGAFAFMETSIGNSIPSWVILLMEYFPLVVGAIGAGVFSLIAYGFRVNRLYVYGILTLTLFAAANFLVSFPFPYAVVLLGILILFSGAVLMFRFIRKYPLPATKPAGDLSNDKQ